MELCQEQKQKPNLLLEVELDYRNMRKDQIAQQLPGLISLRLAASLVVKAFIALDSATYTQSK